MRLSLRGVAAAAIAVLIPGGAAQAEVFDPETFTLDNGMQVIVVTNDVAPVVSHMVWYKVGAADEPPGQSGIAHLLEHLMFRGTETVADGEFNAIVARNGGRDNAFTSWDYTAYFQNVARDRLELVMQLEADRMANLVLDPEIVLIERDVVMEERRQRIDNRPTGRLTEQMISALYQNHPYGIPIIGWPEEIAQLEPDALIAFYETWYAPNNAVLVVSGDIDAETLRPLAKATYGQVPSRPVPERIRPQEPVSASERQVIIRDPTVQRVDWRRYYQAPSYPAGDIAYDLQVLNEILGAGTSSRLYRALVIDQGLAVGAGTNYQATGLDSALFGVFITPQADADPHAVAAAYEAELQRLLDDGVTAAELDAAKQRLVTSAIYARDSVQSPAYSFGLALTGGQTVDDVEAWPARISAVTADGVLAAAETVLRPERAVTGLLLPETTPPATH